jgi:hypothetical protein
MPELLATWDDFTGGHWGSRGPRNAEKNQWGGANLLLARDGGLAPVTASRHLPIQDETNGAVWGMFYAWGVDGNVYYLQQTDATVFQVQRFLPDPTTGNATQQTVGTITGVAAYDADFVAVGSTIYMTVYGDATYAINSEAGTMAALTGSYGNAPAGRATALYGERLLVAGVSDARFGTVPNRIVFSGDDTNNDPTDRTAWETLNYFDIGADNAFITALLPIRDYLVVMTSDQQVWAVTGVPGVNASARRVYGFHKGSGAVEHFKASHCAVDPSQIRIWFYDHTYRAPSRFNGATVARTPEFGTPTSDRVASVDLEGPLTMLGGPDEYMVNGVALGRGAGAQTVNQDLGLVRYAGVNHIILSENLDVRPPLAEAGSGLSYLETFTGSDGNLGTVTTDLTWTVPAGSVPLVSSNQATAVGIGVGRAEHETSTTDQYVECDWTAAAALDQIFLFARNDDAGGADPNSDNKVYLFVHTTDGIGTEVEIDNWLGTGTALDVTLPASGPIATWRLEVEGTTATAYRDGVSVLTGSIADYSPAPAGKQAGFEVEIGTTAVIDNFGFGDL